MGRDILRPMEAYAPRYDVVVVGARCAGAATALLLARRGARVLLFDRDRRGADTLSTLAMMRAGVFQLHHWGVLPAVQQHGTPAIRFTSFVYGDEVITVPIKPRDGVGALYAPRRTLLDTLLADEAARAGAQVRHGPRVQHLLRDHGGRVLGLVLEERDGSLHHIHADLVIGADGLRSTVARQAGAAVYKEGRHTAGVVYTFWPGLPNEGYQWRYRPGVSVGLIPTNGGETCLFVATSVERFHREVRKDLEEGYRRLLQECHPELALRLAGVSPSEPYRGFPGQVGLMRQSHGQGWALVGDAGYFKDPITAHGISDALRDAGFLARAVAQGTESALTDYQATRDELSLELFDLTDEIAGFEWDLETLKVLHKRLSVAMNREVEALVALDQGAPLD
ncbi:MAG TPA: NAD(P)/FAD-dependent oxidoreductase [Candidatus Eisenbacteria bacterium]|nr:NAD(P)/FAD-dependent oxidoreductase [Candidatus Eisenbacteria bacterium]